MRSNSDGLRGNLERLVALPKSNVLALWEPGVQRVRERLEAPGT